MKRILYLLFAVSTLWSCNSDYDDSALTGRVDDLENRVAKLEELCKHQHFIPANPCRCAPKQGLHYKHRPYYQRRENDRLYNILYPKRTDYDLQRTRWKRRSRRQTRRRRERRLYPDYRSKAGCRRNLLLDA